jgi:hypothetical protein
VIVHKQRVVVHFPEKTLTSHKAINMPTVPTNALTINQHVLFHSDWLPIYNITDFFKCQDMLQRMYLEYSKFFTYWPGTQTTGLYDKMFDELRTDLKNTAFSLMCNEGYYYTNIVLTTDTNFPPTDMNPFFHVEIHIGSSLIFSSKRDLGHLDQNTFDYVLDFILQKITKF